MNKIIGKLNHMLIMLCLGRGIMHVYILFLLACLRSFIFIFKTWITSGIEFKNIFIMAPRILINYVTSTVLRLFVLP